MADPFIFGNFFISLCASALVLSTYILLGLPPKFDGLVLFVFFATLALYNFHRLMGIRKIKPEDQGEITGWAARHQFALLMLIIIGVGGMGFFFFQLPSTIGLVFLPLGSVTLLYELPLLKFEKQFQRLRNVWFSKALVITAVWGITTAIFPALNAGIPLTDFRIWMVFIERILFIAIIALCFDARDVIYDAREGLKTVPVVFGEAVTLRLYQILAGALAVVSGLHLLILQWQPWSAFAMLISTATTFIVVTKAREKKGDYYYLFVVDGMLLLQWLLLSISLLGN